MKRNKILLLFLGLIGIGVLTSCTDNDYYYSGTEIDIYGDNPLYIQVGDNWKDFVPNPSAKAYDPYCGIYDFYKRNNINNTTPGEYYVDYIAINGCGDETIKSRTVIVQDNDAYLEGTYDVTNSFGGNVYTYQTTIIPSTSVNKQIYINKLSNNATGSIYAIVDGNVVTIPSQTVGGIIYSGTGHIYTSDTETSIDINYTEIDGNTSSNGNTNMKKVGTSN
ncbi:MAG: immunoglobulin-like domain-containing protein [Hyphomicrobiales bacterium]